MGVVASDVEDSRLANHDCPLLSRNPSVNDRAVCVSQSGSACSCDKATWDLLFCLVAGLELSVADSGVNFCTIPSFSGICILTLLLIFRFLLDARDRTGELVRMPLGEGNPEICEREVELCSSAVSGSKYAA